MSELTSHPATERRAIVAAALVGEILYKGTVLGWTGGAADAGGADGDGAGAAT